MVVATMLERHINFKMTVFTAFEDTLPVCTPYLLAKSQQKTRANETAKRTAEEADGHHSHSFSVLRFIVMYKSRAK